VFKPVIRTVKMYVEHQYTIFTTLCETFFLAFFVTDRCVMTRFPSVGVSNINS